MSSGKSSQRTFLPTEILTCNETNSQLVWRFSSRSLSHPRYFQSAPDNHGCFHCRSLLGTNSVRVVRPVLGSQSVPQLPGGSEVGRPHPYHTHRPHQPHLDAHRPVSPRRPQACAPLHRQDQLLQVQLPRMGAERQVSNAPGARRCFRTSYPWEKLVLPCRPRCFDGRFPSKDVFSALPGAHR